MHTGNLAGQETAPVTELYSPNLPTLAVEV